MQRFLKFGALLEAAEHRWISRRKRREGQVQEETWFSSCSLCKLHPTSYSLSQKGWGWQGPQELIWSHRCSSSTTQSRAPRLMSRQLLEFPKERRHSLSGQHAPVLHHAHSTEVLPGTQGEPPYSSLCPSCPGTELWQKEPPFRYLLAWVRWAGCPSFIQRYRATKDRRHRGCSICYCLILQTTNKI